MVLNFNQMNNSWLNMFQQGLGMFGINSNGYGSFGSMGMMGMNGSLFNYNVDYDAMAGFAVTNAVLGVANQAISSNKAEKQAEKNAFETNKKDVENIDKKIADLNLEKAEPKIDKKYETNIEKAQKSVNTLTDKQKVLEGTGKGSIKELETKLNSTTDEKEKQKIQEQKDKLEKELSELKKKISEAQTELNEAKEAKNKAIEDRKNAIDEEIKNLEQEKKEIQAEVDAYVLDNADGNKLTRTSDKKFDTFLENGVAKENQNYARADVKTAINRFMKELDGTPQKMQAAKNLVTMFNNCSDWNNATRSAAEVAKRYIDEHEEKAE